MDNSNHDNDRGPHYFDSSSSFQSQYPDPVRALDHPYPALKYGSYGPYPDSQLPVQSSGTTTDPSLLPIATDPTLSSRATNDASIESVSDDYRALAERFHLRHGDPGRPNHRNWHLQPGEHIQLELSNDVDDDADTVSEQHDELHWRNVAQDATEREDVDDDDFRPDDAALDAVLDDMDIVEEARPRGRGRGRPRKRGGTTRRGWRQLLRGTEHADVGRTPRESKPRRGGSRKKGALRDHVDPGYAFKEHQRLATQAWVNGEFEEAADFARQAIQANPEIFAAHSLLAEILKSQGKEADAMMVLRTGAYTLRQPATWMTVGNRMREVAGDNPPNEAMVRSAIDCYAEALKLKNKLNDDLDYELRMAKFYAARDIGDDKLARADCRVILRMWPGEIELCREYAQLCYRLEDKSELTRAKEAYDAAFEDHAEDEVFSAPEDSWNHINVYLELVDMVGQPSEGIFQLKRLARWLLGRKNEAFWDRYTEDDREFDNDAERRGMVPEFQSGQASFDKLSYGEALPVEIRNRLGLFRLKMGLGYYDEARRHFQPLLMQTDQIDVYYDSFLQTATALRENGLINEAVEYYDALRMVPEVVDEPTWLVMGDTYRMKDRQDDAIECYEEAAEVEGKSHATALQELAKLYEAIGEAEKAKDTCSRLVKLGRRDLLSAEQLKEFPEPPKTRLGRRERTTKAMKMDIARRASRNADTQGLVEPEELHDTQRFVPAGEGAFAEFQLHGPAFDGEPGDDSETAGTRTAPKKRRGRASNKRSFLATLDEGNNEDATPDGEDVKRPKLTPRPYRSRRYKLAQQRFLQMQDAGARVQANFSVVQLNWPALSRGDDEAAIEQWMESAANLVVDFADMKVFFPDRDRNDHIRKMEEGVYIRMPGTASNSEYAPPRDFHSITFPEWHRAFVDLALLYAKRGEQDKCYRLLQDVLFSANVFYLAPELDQTNYGAAICCALMFNDSQYLIDLSRKMIAKSDHRSAAAFQLFATVNRLTYGPGWFNAGPSQKFMLRMVKQTDFVTMPVAARDQFDWSIQKPSLLQREARHRQHAQAQLSSPSLVPPAPSADDLDPGILLMYGHMVAVANHSHSALPYYFRALALAPDSACINLSIATMWVQNSMKRQTDNRQFGIAQGLAFLYRYYDLRTKGTAENEAGEEKNGEGEATEGIGWGKAIHRQEAEFNVARMWHHLGLTHLAVPGYERVLGMSEGVREEWYREREERRSRKEGGGERGDDDGDDATAATAVESDDDDADKDDEPEDFATEAAFALQGLYALAGDEETARRIGEEWLVI